MEDSEMDCSGEGNKLRDLDGAIESVAVKNFFCHDYLEIDFHKNINFVIGRNGSGKSAILTALVVGLGARAAATNRGNSLKSFIKKGANSASIEIKIKNNTPHAYKRDVYGDTITIIRIIHSSGASNYKIKSTSGEVITTKHDEVFMICTVHNIQVDNPVCVLNQDDARNFHAADSKLKYSLFRRATNMDVILQNYNKAFNNCVRSKNILSKKKEAFTELEKEVDTLKLQYEQLQSQDEIENQLNDVENEFYWSEIAEFEASLQKIKNEHAKQEEKINKIKGKKINFDSAHDQHNEEIRELKAQIETLQVDNVVVGNELSEKANAIHKVKSVWKLSMQNVQKKKEQMLKENTNIIDLSTEISVAVKMNRANEAENMENKMEELSNQLQEAVARKNTLTNELFQIRNASSHSQSEYENLIMSQNRLLGQLNKLKSQFNELSVRGKDNLAMYGSNMIDLVKAVNAANNRREFSIMPQGPIGFFLKVRDKKWTSTLEHIIGGHITTFCVNNEQDSRKLISIINQIYRPGVKKPTVWTSKFINQVHNVSRTAVEEPPGCISALNCLEIEEPVIANFVIDSLRVESTLLVPTQDEATRLASDINNVPRNCMKIVTQDSQEFYPAPNYRSYGGLSRPSKYLQVNMQERKIQIQSEINEAERETQKVRRDLNEMNTSRNQLRKSEGELDTRLRKLTSGIQSIESNLAKLESSLRHLESGHIRLLNEELELASSKISKFKEEEAALVREEQTCRQTMIDLESSVALARSKKRSIEDVISALTSKIRQKSLDFEKNKIDHSVLENRLQKENETLDKLYDYIIKIRDVIFKKIRDAEMLCPRITDPRDKNVVSSEIDKLKARLKSLNKNAPNKEQLSTLLLEKSKLRQNTFETLKLLLNLINELQKTVKDHLHFAMSVEDLTFNRAKYFFTSILRLRSYSGDLKIDKEKRTLEIFCTGRDSAKIRKANTTSSLSGGERSYATVAFIMALWDCMDLPFYFLDEFDVFMDNVNRKITMDLLIDHAKKCYNTQFVFLTPQDTSTIMGSDSVKIHRLADPVRRQD